MLNSALTLTAAVTLMASSTFLPANAFSMHHLQTHQNQLQTQTKFRQSQIRLPTTRINALIEVDEEISATEGEAALKMGGVGLAQESVLVMTGGMDSKSNSVVANGLERYAQLTSLGENAGDGVAVICKGTGVESYVDPGLSTNKDVTLAPLDAVQNALSGVASSPGSNEEVCIHFAGGGDLMVNEVLEGVAGMVAGLGLGSSVTFKSFSHESFPLEKCSVVALKIGADGNVFWHEGQWWTVKESDLNTVDA